MCLWSLFLTINLKNLPQELPTVGAAHSAWSGPLLTANWQLIQTSSDQGLIPFLRLYVVTHLFPKRQEIAGFCVHVRVCGGGYVGGVVCDACTPVCIGTHICVACMEAKGWHWVYFSTLFHSIWGDRLSYWPSDFGFWLASKSLEPSYLRPSNGIAEVCCQAGFLPRCLGSKLRSSDSHRKCFTNWANTLAWAFVHFFRLIAMSTQFLDSLINCLKVAITIF